MQKNAKKICVYEKFVVILHAFSCSGLKKTPVGSV